MEFDYEISADDYAAAHILLHKLSGKRLASAWWFLGGAFLLLVALIERDRGWSPILLGAVGIWWMWAGVAGIFPGESMARPYRKRYQEIKLKGKKCRASINNDGFQLFGENSSWSIRWADISQKGEDDRIFMFYSQGVLSCFGKRYLAEEQQQALRRLAGLPAASVA